MRSKGDMCSSFEHFWSSTAPTQCRTIEPAPGGIISLCETCAQLGQRAESAQWRKCVCNLPGNCCNITNCAAEGQPGLTAPDYQMLWGDGWDVGGEGPVRCKEGRELLACKGHGMDVMQADCGGQYYSSVRVAAWLIGVFDLWALFLRSLRCRKRGESTYTKLLSDARFSCCCCCCACCCCGCWETVCCWCHVDTPAGKRPPGDARACRAVMSALVSWYSEERN